MLQELVKDYSDEQLLDAYRQRGEYTDEAVKIFEAEIARRGLDATVAAAEEKQERTAAAAFVAAASMANLSRADFAPLPGFFTKADALIANSVLNDSKVPYTIEERKDDGDSADSGNADGESCGKNRAAAYNVLVYKDALDKAREMIGEHFHLSAEGQYIMLDAGIAERLKAFCFSDVRLSDEAARERFDVDFSEREKLSLVNLAKFLLDEADEVEERQNRMLFFYDGLETLVKKLTQGEQLTRVDFLAIIELCQIYCEDERYDAELNQTASSILSFFLE